MIAATLAAILACFACSSLSRSSFMWTAILAAGAAVTYVLGSNDFYNLVWFLDFTMILVMFGSRQTLNEDWQRPALALQGTITILYVTNAAFSGAHPWLTYHVVHWGNWAYLAQLLIVGSAGLGNSIRNYRYVRDQRKAGQNAPWIRTAWRMT